MEICCVYSKDKHLIKQYVNKINSKYVINYSDIFNKLTKNDVYLNEPTEMIVFSKIYTIFQKILSTYKPHKIYYIIHELDVESLKNLKVIIKNLYNNTFYFNLIIKSDDYIEEYNHLFDDVKFFT